jgi:hypothetical protein
MPGKSGRKTAMDGLLCVFFLEKVSGNALSAGQPHAEAQAPPQGWSNRQAKKDQDGQQGVAGGQAGLMAGAGLHRWCVSGGEQRQG